MQDCLLFQSGKLVIYQTSFQIFTTHSSANTTKDNLSLSPPLPATPPSTFTTSNCCYSFCSGSFVISKTSPSPPPPPPPQICEPLTQVNKIYMFLGVIKHTEINVIKSKTFVAPRVALLSESP